MAPKALSKLLACLARRRQPGAAGESLACRHLEASGYVILERNFRCRSGEVDVVARHGNATVFVEVKERRGTSHGEGHEAVTFGKRQRIVRAARLYAAARGLSEAAIRFDVISILQDADGRRHLRHDAGAFDCNGR